MGSLIVMGVLSIYIKPNQKLIFKMTKHSNYMRVGDLNSYDHKLIYKQVFYNGTSKGLK